MENNIFFSLNMDDVKCVMEGMSEEDRIALEGISLSDMEKFQIYDWSEYVSTYLDYLAEKKRKEKLLEKLSTELDSAIAKYGRDKIDIIAEGENYYGSYCDKSNSFGVTSIFNIRNADFEIQALCDKKEIGFSC